MDRITFNELANIISRNDWDENDGISYKDFNIKQFPSTAFCSDYKCYKIIDNKNKRFFVAKITNKTEPIILNRLHADGYNVPKVLSVLPSRSTNKVMIFEEFLKGTELYKIRETQYWDMLAKELGRIHSNYWNIKDRDSSYWSSMTATQKEASIAMFNNKLNDAFGHVAFRDDWNNTFNCILDRINVAPRTLIHGDAFPTNFLIDGNKVFFVDLANAGEYPYMLDIGRLTALSDVETKEPFCPDIDNFCRKYYNSIKIKLHMSFEGFMNDVYIAQFIELAHSYTPPIGLNAYSFLYKREENKKIETKLTQLSNIIE